MNMKKIGIIGGAGPLASVLLYQLIIEETYRSHTKMPEIFIINYPFTRGVSRHEGHTNSSKLVEELSYCVDLLLNKGIEIGVLACNTLHLYLPLIKQCVLPFLQIPLVVLEEAFKRKAKRLLLLATENSCHSNLYAHSQLEVLRPPAAMQRVVDDVINTLLCGHVRSQESEQLSEFIQDLSYKMHFDGVILGCSELPVLNHRFPLQTTFAIYDSIKIPAQFLGGLS